MAAKQQQKKDGTKAAAQAAPKAMFGFTPDGPDGAGNWLTTAKPASKASGGQGKPRGRALLVGQGVDLKKALTELGWDLPAWLIERAQRRRGDVVQGLIGEEPVWIALAQPRAVITAHHGLLDASPYGIARDMGGAVAAQLADYGLTVLEVSAFNAQSEEELGFLVGLEIGAYRYRGVRQPRSALPLPQLKLTGSLPDQVEAAMLLANSVNLARHLVNVPAGELNPTTLSDALVGLFAGSKTTTVDVWTGKKLESEGLGLLRAVGQGATFGPALVHLSYRPAKAKRKKPLAFVGKGVTFDSGGLDIKDASSMRLMKKDMGGAASLVGLAYWVERSAISVPCDFYLAVAENSVDKDSFHPGDVITARSGMTIEIDNTDAEGRLVMADALDVAIKAAETPAAVIDLATLTGAMRVALGVRIAGLLATDDQLADELLRAAQKRADPIWRLPLFVDYLAGLKSTVADLANAGPGRFGGGITAALFLQRFVGQVPWAHLDMYGWTEAQVGGVSETGGNGQCIQLLTDFLTAWQEG